MSVTPSPLFAPRGSAEEVERGDVFQPGFGPDGLIPAIVSDADAGDVLMFAWMNGEALQLTIETGLAHFWTRSRQRIWRKGEESGNVLRIREIRTDCDQDVLWIKAHVEGDGVACHTGQRSCFYRALSPQRTADGAVRLVSVAEPEG